jgi:tRNA A-37 threonylcarbamoyl transferase component Bud32
VCCNPHCKWLQSEPSLALLLLTPPLAPCLRAAGADELLTELGRVLAVLHNGGVVHGGLSCSCVLVRATDQALVSVCGLCTRLSTNSPSG